MAKRTLGVTNFLPQKHRCPVIYAVVLRDHPEIVKVGRTANWPARRNAYAKWNLRDGDGILCERLFEINEEYVDLPDIEAAVLTSMPSKPVHGLEWFRADLDEVLSLIDSILFQGSITSTYHDNDPND